MSVHHAHATSTRLRIATISRVYSPGGPAHIGKMGYPRGSVQPIGPLGPHTPGTASQRPCSRRRRCGQGHRVRRVARPAAAGWGRRPALSVVAAPPGPGVARCLALAGLGGPPLEVASTRYPSGGCCAPCERLSSRRRSGSAHQTDCSANRRHQTRYGAGHLLPVGARCRASAWDDGPGSPRQYQDPPRPGDGYPYTRPVTPGA